MPITTMTSTTGAGLAEKIPDGATVIAITVSGTKMDVFTAFIELPPQAVEEEEEEEEEQNPSGGKSKRTRRRRRRHA